MRTFFIILICKFVIFIRGLVGKGSSLPGEIATQLDKNILTKLKLPRHIIAVSGSNGKTSTVEMIAHILKESGMTVAYNELGSNQIAGVATILMRDCNLFGRAKSDVLLIECDEQFSKHVFRHITPTHFVITNLYRDQLTRNGHPEWIYDCLNVNMSEDIHLVLNADDPLVSRFGYGRENVTYFGVEKLAISHEEYRGIYNDGTFCPVCKGRMVYDYYHFNHIGRYHCPSCGFRRNDTQFTVTSADLGSGELVINDKYTIRMDLKSIYNVYNILAAFAACSLVGADEKKIAASVSDYVLTNGRVVDFAIGEHKGTLLTSKHENSVSYDNSLTIATSDTEDCDVVIIVDAVSRKYFTSDVSWLWDVNFELLKSENIKEIILSGLYVNDLYVRFSFTGIPEEKIRTIQSIDEMAEYLEKNGSRKLYVITCFSDKGKFLAKVKEG